MAAGWWWPLPAWLGSSAGWFLVLNAVVAAIAVLSRGARPSLASPRITRRASSAVLQRLRSFSIFSSPSASLHTAPSFQSDTAEAVSRETEEPETSPIKSPSRALALASPKAEEDEDPDAMSMEEAYALALAARQRPEREREEEARRSEVDTKAEEFIRGFREDLRQQRLKSIFNYTQMLKQRAPAAAGSRQTDVRPDQL